MRDRAALGVRVDARKEKFGELVIIVQPNLSDELQARFEAIIVAAADATQGV